MKIITWILLLCLVVVALSAITLALGLGNDAMLTVHKIAGGCFIIFALLHIYVFRRAAHHILGK